MSWAIGLDWLRRGLRVIGLVVGRMPAGLIPSASPSPHPSPHSPLSQSLSTPPLTSI